MYAPLSVGNMSESSGDSVCRLCLREGNSMTYIFDPKGWNGFRVWEIIKELIQLEISKDDGLPGTVCPSCLKKVVDYKYFKTMCINSKISFLTMIATRGMVPSDTDSRNIPNFSIPHINSGNKTDSDDEIIEIVDCDDVESSPIKAKEAPKVSESSKTKDDNEKRLPPGKNARKQNNKKGHSAKRRRISSREDDEVVELVGKDAPSAVEVSPCAPEVPAIPVATPCIELSSSEEKREAPKTRQPAKKPSRKSAASKKKAVAAKPTEELPKDTVDVPVEVVDNDDSANEFETVPVVAKKVPDVPLNPPETVEKKAEGAKARPPAKKRKKKASHYGRRPKKPSRPKKVSVNFIEIPQPSATTAIQAEVINDEFEIDLGDVEPAGRDPLSLVKEEEDVDGADGLGDVPLEKSKGDSADAATEESAPARRRIWEIGVNVKSEARNNEENNESSDDDRGTPMYMDDEEGSVGSENEGREIEMDIVEEKYSAMLTSMKSPSSSKKKPNSVDPEPQFRGEDEAIPTHSEPTATDPNAMVPRQEGVNFISFTVIPSNDDVDADIEGDGSEIDPFACISDDPNPSESIVEETNGTPGENYIESVIPDPVIPVTEFIQPDPQGTAMANHLNQPRSAEIPILGDHGTVPVPSVEHISPMLVPVSVTATEANITAQLPRLPCIGVPEVPLTVCDAVPLSLAIGAAPQLCAREENSVLKYPAVVPVDRVSVEDEPMNLSTVDHKGIAAKLASSSIMGSNVLEGTAKMGDTMHPLNQQPQAVEKIRPDDGITLSSLLNNTPQMTQVVAKPVKLREGVDYFQQSQKQMQKRKSQLTWDSLDENSSNDEWVPDASEVSSEDSDEDWQDGSRKAKAKAGNKTATTSENDDPKGTPGDGSVELERRDKKLIGPNPILPDSVTSVSSVIGSDSPVLNKPDSLLKRSEHNSFDDPKGIGGCDGLKMKFVKNKSIPGNISDQSGTDKVQYKIKNSSSASKQDSKAEENDKVLTMVLSKTSSKVGGVSILRKPTTDVEDGTPIKTLPPIYVVPKSSTIRNPSPPKDQKDDDVEFIKAVEVPKTDTTKPRPLDQMKAGDIIKAMSEKLFKCSWCDVVGHGISGIAEHMKAAHKIRIHQEVSVFSANTDKEDIQSLTKLNCKFCNTEFTTVSDLYVHNLYICRKKKETQVAAVPNQITSVLKQNMAILLANAKSRSNPQRDMKKIHQFFQKQTSSENAGTNVPGSSQTNNKNTNPVNDSAMKTPSKDDSKDCQPVSVMVKTYRCKHCPGKFKDKAEFKAHRMNAHRNIPSGASEELDGNKSDSSCSSVVISKTIDPDKGPNVVIPGKHVPTQPVAPFLVSPRNLYFQTPVHGITARTDNRMTTVTSSLNNKDTSRVQITGNKVHPHPNDKPLQGPSNPSYSNPRDTRGSVAPIITNRDDITPNSTTVTNNSNVTSKSIVTTPYTITTSCETTPRTTNVIVSSPTAMTSGFIAPSSSTAVVNPCVTSPHKAPKASDCRNRAINILLSHMDAVETANPITSGDEIVSRESIPEDTSRNSASSAHTSNIRYNAGLSTAASLNSAIPASTASVYGSNVLNSPVVSCPPNINSKASVITVNPSLSSGYIPSSGSNFQNSVMNSAAVPHNPINMHNSSVSTANPSLSSSYIASRSSDLGNSMMNSEPVLYNPNISVSTANPLFTSPYTTSSLSNLGNSVTNSAPVPYHPSATSFAPYTFSKPRSNVSKTSVRKGYPSLTSPSTAPSGSNLGNSVVNSAAVTSPPNIVSDSSASSAYPSLSNSYAAFSGSSIGSTVVNSPAASYSPNVTSKTSVATANTPLTSSYAATTGSNYGDYSKDNAIVDYVGEATPKTPVSTNSASSKNHSTSSKISEQGNFTSPSSEVSPVDDVEMTPVVSNPNATSSEDSTLSPMDSSSEVPRCTMCYKEFEDKHEVNKHFGKVHIPQLYEMQRVLQKNKPYLPMKGS